MEAQEMETGEGARPRRVLRAPAIAVAIGVGLAVIAHALAQAPAPPATAPAATPAAAAPPPQPDPSGTATGTVADVPAKEAGKPTLAEVADTVGHNKVSINMMWTFVTGFLVMFMQAGFALAQVIGTLTCFVFIFGLSWIFFKVMDAVMGMRVSPEVELEGLDVPEMGVHGYPEIQGPSTVVRHNLKTINDGDRVQVIGTVGLAFTY